MLSEDESRSSPVSSTASEDSPHLFSLLRDHFMAFVAPLDVNESITNSDYVFVVGTPLYKREGSEGRNSGSGNTEKEIELIQRKQ